MEIHPVEVTAAGGTVTARSRIVTAAGEKTLWFELDDAYTPWLRSDRLDAFLVASLPLAMRDRRDVLVHGAVSEKLLYNLSNHYMPILALQVPGLEPVRIAAAGVAAAAPVEGARGVATGFSAGVDSLCTLHDHFIAPVPSRYKLTHLLFSNVGSHGYEDHDRARLLFRARYERVRQSASEFGLDLIRVDSNLSELVIMAFGVSQLTRNVAPVLLLQGLFAKYYYASSYRYQDVFIGKTHNLAFADPAAVHLLSTETLECSSSGAQYSRVEKTAKVAHVPGAERWLNVCIDPDGDGTNCSMCSKCCRTLFTLELLGELSRFEKVFDLARWSRVRTRYIRSTILAGGDDPYVREIREHCEASGYSFRRRDLVASTLHRLRRRLA